MVSDPKNFLTRSNSKLDGNSKSDLKLMLCLVDHASLKPHEWLSLELWFFSLSLNDSSFLWPASLTAC